MVKDNSYSSVEIANSINARIDDLKKENKNVTAKEMLKEIGIGSNTISNMKHGSMIAADSLAKIADYLNCSVDFLLGRDGGSKDETFKPTRRGVEMSKECAWIMDTVAMLPTEKAEMVAKVLEAILEERK